MLGERSAGSEPVMAVADVVIHDELDVKLNGLKASVELCVADSILASEKRSRAYFDARMDRLEARMDRLEAKVDALEAKVNAIIDHFGIKVQS